MMQWFKDAGLGTKLSLILLLFFGILLVSLTFLLVYNTQSLTLEIANAQISQELNTIVSRLNDIQSGIESDLSFLVADITFFQAVGRRSQNDLSEIIGRTRLTSPIYDVEIVDGDGNFLIDTQANDTNSSNSPLLNQRDQDEIQSFLNVESTATQTQIYFSSVSPVKSVTRNFLGAIQVSRLVDSKLLQDITAQRSDVFIGLVYEGGIVIQSNADSVVNPNSLFNIQLEESALSQSQAGETAIIDELVTSNNVSYKVAYAPIIIDGQNSSVSLMVLVELSQLTNFQSATLNNTVIIFVFLTLIIVLLTYLALRRLAVKPIENLKLGAEKLVEGDYNQTIPMLAKDELGQLASTFNLMVHTIQEREESLKESRLEAERANHVKSAFLASMSHELRTPLNAIINFSGFVADGDVGPVSEEQKEVLDDVVKSGKHLLNLINDVLDMSKIEAGSLQLFVSNNLDVNSILKEAHSTGLSLLKGPDVELVLKTDDSIPLISGDKNRIIQVLLNLVSNACKFTEKGTIELESKKVGETILISVRDSGMGIDKGYLEKIFQPFIQTEAGIRQGGGTGLGLPISKNLVEAHQGKIWVESEVGKGSTFYVSLPITTELQKEGIR
jgi:signal transduction histidine kinase